MYLLFAGRALAQECDGCTNAPCNNHNSNGICCADLTGDGVVDQDDVGLFLANLNCGGECNCLGDLDHDGDVDECDACIMEHEYESCTGYAPLLLEQWNPVCYGNCSDSGCVNDPNIVNCCDDDCPQCIGGEGCLPITKHSVTFADLDSDGWVDAATWVRDPNDQGADPVNRRTIFWNEFASGVERWTEGCLLDGYVQDLNFGYAQTLGDMNNDGYPDYASEAAVPLFLGINLGLARRCASLTGCEDPRALSGQCGGCSVANFVQVAECLGVDGYPGRETHCWGDCDGDGDLDLFMPVEDTTPPVQDIAYYLNNLGPCEPQCDLDCGAMPTLYCMEEIGGQAGLRPTDAVQYAEGAQLCDYDYDGDLDIVFAEQIFQNNTTLADYPSFTNLDEDDSGLDPIGGVDEGLLLVDLDMDGDLDVIRHPAGGSGRASRHRGDGTFADWVGFFTNGTAWGASSADWDNDGDVDLTLSGAFMRNTTVEEALLGNACAFAECLHLVTCFSDPNCANLVQACPSWADVDRDGDLDCARAKFGSGDLQKMLRNTLYADECEPESSRRYVNVRPVRSAPENGPFDRDYTENEFGARVEVVLRNNPLENTSRLRRVQFTASSSGYVNQNEYMLHFGLPPDPDPNDPNEDLHLDLYVDFPTRANEGNDPNEGPWRVDWTVNPLLADINLADLYPDPMDPNTFGRTITVYRDGRVRFLNGEPNDPADPNGAHLYTLGGPLLFPAEGTGSGNCILPCPTSENKLAGVRFTKDPNTPEVRIREIIIDGQLAAADPNCGYNIVVLDVTDPNTPLPMGGMVGYTFADNNRTFLHVPPDPNDPNAFVLPNAGSTRTYDVRVRVSSYRMNALSNLSALDGPLGITVTGGLQLVDSSDNICTKVMSVSLIGGSQTSPVKVRLSQKAD